MKSTFSGGSAARAVAPTSAKDTNTSRSKHAFHVHRKIILGSTPESLIATAASRKASLVDRGVVRRRYGYRYGFFLTNVCVKSSTERVKLHGAVSGTLCEGDSIQLSMTYWSGAPCAIA